jgi:phosphoglycolate phosphatase
MNKFSNKISHFSDICTKYTSFLFDLNGVLWYGPYVYKEAFETLNFLKERGKKVFFISNMSTHTRQKYQTTLKEYGFDTSLDYVYSASYFVPAFIKYKYPEINKVYVLGREGIIEEAKELGLNVVGGVDHDDKMVSTEADFDQMPVDADIKAVLVGEDMKFNFYKLGFSSICIQQNGAKLFAANDDPFDYNGDRNIPSCGALIKAIETSSQVEADVLGKPNPYVIDLITEKFGLEKDKCMMIGDRLNADILLANRAGIDSCLVLSGETKKEYLEKNSDILNTFRPTHICRKVAIK